MRGPPVPLRGAAGADDGGTGAGGFVPGPAGAGVRAGSTAGARTVRRPRGDRTAGKCRERGDRQHAQIIAPKG